MPSRQLLVHSSLFGWGTVLLISVYEEVWRTMSPLLVSYPPGKLNFSFTSSPTDIYNTGADYKAYTDMSMIPQINTLFYHI